MVNKVYVEKYNASDDYFELSEIYIESGKKIEKDELIFSISSSKADIDIESSFLLVRFGDRFDINICLKFEEDIFLSKCNLNIFCKSLVNPLQLNLSPSAFSSR